MDVAYDHIQEEILTPEESAKRTSDAAQKQSTLNAEFQEAYKTFSSTPWGARLGGFFSDVKKQSETFYDGARQEASAAGGEAFKGFTDLRQTLVSRARSMSTGQDTANPEQGNRNEGEKKDVSPTERSESEALRESEGVISRFKTEAAKRLKDLERAEEAADAAIFKFGANIGNFLKEAVTIAPPPIDGEQTNTDGSRKVLFESRDHEGKRVIHTTRFEAQLHAIHSRDESFAKDPESPEWGGWKEGFDVENRTGDIAADLEKYEELRRAMEKLVPEKVEYKDFWTRYYFLRMVVETEEQRRREMLKGAAQHPEETIAWDDDSDSDGEQSSTPQQSSSGPLNTSTAPALPTASTSSSTTIQPPRETPPATQSASEPSSASLKPLSPRRSQDAHSQPDSDASYDLVSGATSRAPGSPKEKEKEKEKGEDEEEDWE